MPSNRVNMCPRVVFGGQVMRVLDRGTSAIQNLLGTVVFSIGMFSLRLREVLMHRVCLC